MDISNLSRLLKYGVCGLAFLLVLKTPRFCVNKTTWLLMIINDDNKSLWCELTYRAKQWLKNHDIMDDLPHVWRGSDHRIYSLRTLGPPVSRSPAHLRSSPEVGQKTQRWACSAADLLWERCKWSCYDIVIQLYLSEHKANKNKTRCKVRIVTPAADWILIGSHHF